MPLFGRKKLTGEQQSEIRARANTLNAIIHEWDQAFKESGPRFIELYNICKASQQHGVYQENTEHLIDGSRDALLSVRETAQDLGNRLSASPPAEWYPQDFKRAYEHWGHCFSISQSALGTVLGGLEPPPLVDEPGKAKLNMFVSGLNLFSQFCTGPEFPTR